MEVGMTLRRALEMVPELRELSKSGSTYEKLIRCALTLEGLARHASTHAAGVLITPGKLTDYVPLFKSGKDEITTQYDMKSIERIGLLKMDFLGLRTLTVIDRSVEMVNSRKDKTLSLNEIPLDDERTFELLRRARTVGVFQLESSGMRELLRKMKPSCLEDIIAVNALHRPGPLQGEMVKDYILCKNGKKRIKYQHPFLEPILKDTHGVILYQEQVLEIAHKLAGFSLAQADILRRAMGKKMPEEMDAQRRTFIDGAKKNGINSKTSERIFNLMANFAGYGFNKSHSTAYAMISYRTAYLKTHFPAEFMAASLTSEMGDTGRVAILVDECRRMGIDILKPSISQSSEEFMVTPAGIGFGLGAVRNVGSGAITSIVEARERGGDFTSIFDLCERVDLRLANKRVLESLICAGACDCLPGHRAQLLSALSSAYASGQKKQRERARGQESFFGSGQDEFADDELPEVNQWPRSILLSREKEMLGFYFSDHPLAPFRKRISSIASCEIERVRDFSDGRNITVVGVVSARKTIVGRNNKPMAFVTLEDFSGSLECIVFSDLYEKVSREIGIDSVLVVRGRTSSKEEEVKLVAQDVEEFRDAAEPSPSVQFTSGSAGGKDEARGSGRDLLEQASGEKTEKACSPAAGLPTLEIQLPSCRTELAGKLREVLDSFPGDSEVILVVSDETLEPVRVRARAVRVTVDDLLLETLTELVGPDRVRVGRPEGEISEIVGRVSSSVPLTRGK